MKSPKKLPATNRYIEALVKQRKPENAIAQYLDGHLDYDELHTDEQHMYNRYQRLTACILDNKGRFDRDSVLKDHMRTFDVSIATAQRDLAFVNNRMALINEAELELHKMALYNKAWKGIKIAEDNDDPKGMAINIKEARELLGIGKEGKSTGPGDQIEQHVNVFIADVTTKDVLLKILEKNISVHEYNMTLEDILQKEKDLQKTIDIPHEEIRSDPHHEGD